ncbi:MAG: hypothetical protein PWQ76_271 [Clostridiales bacterium]|jgi:hypothetical protein|nr:hypothetical protein [Clostridiales bacterium]
MVREYFSLPVYTMFHPSDGFYDMKYEKKGKTSIIFVNLFLFWISYSFSKQYSGFVVNENNPMGFNLFGDLATILIVFLLWCTANWSITTLMNGEGKFKDIAMATSYALMPMIFTFIPASLLSNLFVQQEAAFYTTIMGISIAWSVMLLFFGILTVHNYTVAKTIATLFLTFISICVILFLLMLISSLIQQVWVFVSSIYTELLYRA